MRTPSFILALLMLATPLASPAAPPADAVLQQEIEGVIHETARRWNSQYWSSVLDLWDADEPMPMYLAEEQRNWFVGWGPIKAYLQSDAEIIDALRETMSNIRVRRIAPDLAVAAYNMHFEMQLRGSAPIGEDIRVTAIFRRKPDGWKYIHYAEAPMTTPVYMSKLMRRDVQPAFKEAQAAGKAKRAAKEAAKEAAGEAAKPET
jgi:hypothetical protein